MLPLVGMLVVLAGIRSFNDELVVQQIYGVSSMLLFVGLTTYSLDAVQRVVGLGEDRLLLLSPRSRWSVAAKTISVVCVFLAAGYLATLIPHLEEVSAQPGVHVMGLVGYIISIVAGLGLMLFVVYLLKPIRNRVWFVLGSWLLFGAVVATTAVGCILALTRGADMTNWLLGVSAGDGFTNVYASVLPITVGGIPQGSKVPLAFVAGNLLLAVFFWLLAALLARRPNNYLRL